VSSERLCIGDCGTVVSGRRRRCPECRRRLQRRLDKRRYHASRDQDVTDYKHPDDLPVIDFSRGAVQRPPDPNAPARPYRPHPSHDRAAWIQRQAAQHAENELADQSSWDQLQDARLNDRRVTFPPAPGSPAGDLFGRRAGRYQGQPIDNPAADGDLYRASPLAGQRALYRHVGGR
jgi:hypothetical protein